MEKQELHDLLMSNSTDKFYIEHTVYRSNHLAHGVIALYRLGASREKVQKFIDRYSAQLDDTQHPAEARGDDNDIQSLLGQRRSYYVILKHYQSLLQETYGGSLEDFIAAELPKIVAGLAGSALHGMIHVGYGYSVKDARIVCEGFAYIHHSYLPLICQKATALKLDTSTDIISLLEKMATNEELKQLMEDGATDELWDKQNRGPFSRRMGVLLERNGDVIAGYFESLELPDFVKVASGEVDVEKLRYWLVDAALTVFLKSSRQNDFFLLHGVTCAWALSQVLPVFTSQDDVMFATRAFVCTLLAVYMVQGCPALTNQIEDTRHVTEKDMEMVVRKATGMEADEHVYKLTQICYDMSKISPKNLAMYFQASDIVTSLPLLTTNYKGGSRAI